MKTNKFYCDTQHISSLYVFFFFFFFLNHHWDSLFREGRYIISQDRQDCSVITTLKLQTFNITQVISLLCSMPIPGWPGALSCHTPAAADGAPPSTTAAREGALTSLTLAPPSSDSWPLLISWEQGNAALPWALRARDGKCWQVH